MGEMTDDLIAEEEHLASLEVPPWDAGTDPATTQELLAIGAAVLDHCDGIEWSITIRGGAGQRLVVIARSTLTDAVEGYRARDIEAAIEGALGT